MLAEPGTNPAEMEASVGRGVDGIPSCLNFLSSLSGVLCLHFAWKMAGLVPEGGLMAGAQWGDGRAVVAQFFSVGDSWLSGNW